MYPPPNERTSRKRPGELKSTRPASDNVLTPAASPPSTRPSAIAVVAMSPRSNASVKASIWTARFIPAFLVAIVIYASWAVVDPLSINYLINPPRDDIPRRISAGIAIPIVYFVLLIPVATTWLRLLLVVLRDPGYIPRGPEEERRLSEPAPGIEDFWTRDVFVCDPNGMPIYCEYCKNWKPDRTHHSQDVARCTRKMDHFCPWVGGVVGERGFKFFVQFLFYTMVLTCYLTTVFGYFISKYTHSVHFFVVLALAGFFLLFTTGMVMNSLHMVFQNTTTIEGISRRMYLAVILPPELQKDPMAPPPPAKLSPTDDTDSERPLTSELDDPSHVNYFTRQPRPPKRPQPPSVHSPVRSKIWKGTITYPLHLPIDRPPLPAPERRTFAILHTPPGLNPWNLGSVYRNFTAVFGNHVHEWVIPLKMSPCCDHSSRVSEFPLGPEFELLLVDAGLIRPESSEGKDRRSSPVPSRKRRRRLEPGWQNGERPDGWVSEKEARRIRNQWRIRTKMEKQPDVH